MVKRKERESKNFLSNGNWIIILVVVVLAYLLLNYSGNGSEDEGLNSMRSSIRLFFVRLFGLGGCNSDSDCENGKFCNQLTKICSATKNKIVDFSDATHE